MSNRSSHLVVLAEFSLRPGSLDAFLELAHSDARESLAREEFCLAFEILIHATDADTVVLHEVYRDRAAFEYHKTLPHFAAFLEGCQPLLASEPVIRLFHSALRGQ